MLGVRLEDARDTETIRKAYRRLALRHHPDKNPGHEEDAKVILQKISAAYSFLIEQIETTREGRSRQSPPHSYSGSPASPSSAWEEAKSVFRNAFGVNFDDAVWFGLSAATNLASDAVSSLPSSLSDLAATQRRRASIRMSSNALAIQRCQSQVTEARQDLKAANEQRETAIKDYNRFFKDPQIRMGNLPFCNLLTARYFGSFSLAWMLLGLKANSNTDHNVGNNDVDAFVLLLHSCVCGESRNPEEKKGANRDHGSPTGKKIGRCTACT